MQLVLLPLAVLGAYIVLRAAGPVILLFIIGGLIALLLNPFVTLLRRIGLPRGLAVLAVMVALIAAVAGLGLLLANPVSDQVSAFQHSVPGIVDDANRTLADFQDWLDRNGINVQVAKEGQTALQTLGENVSAGSGQLVSFTRDAIQTLVEASLALILIIVISVYMLLYGERIGSSVRSVMPRGDGTPEDDFPTRIQSAVLGYVRGQLLFSLIMGTSAGVLLWVLGTLGIFPQGRTYALFFGAWYAFAELIPYIGPAIGGFPPVIIAAFSSEPLDAVWLIIAFTGLQQLEGHVVAPNVFGQALRINPLLVIFALLLGGQIYGFIGAFIALPLAAIIRESIVYFRRHLVFERWDLPAVARPSPGGGGGGGEREPSVSRETEPLPATLPSEPAASGGRTEAEAGEAGVAEASGAAATRRCPECGEQVARDASACSACGTDLGKPDDEAAATSAAPG